MITYQLESWDSYKEEARGLWQQHWNVVGTDKAQVNVDESYYAFLFANGNLQILGARENGRLVGYCLVVVRRHQHYQGMLCGFEDSYFMEPSKGLSLGVRYAKLIRESVRLLEARGVQRVYFCTKLRSSLHRIFQAQGFTQSEVIHTKYLGE